MPFHRSTLVLTIPALLSLAGFNPALADDSIEPGARVRVFAIPLAHPLTGSFAGADSTTLQLEGVRGLGQTDVLRGAVTRFEVSHGKRDYPLQGTLLGAVAGAISLTAVGFLVEDGGADPSNCYDCDQVSDQEERVGYYMIVGGALGAVLGLLVGASIDRDQWVPAEIPAAAR